MLLVCIMCRLPVSLMDILHVLVGLTMIGFMVLKVNL